MGIDARVCSLGCHGLDTCTLGTGWMVLDGISEFSGSYEEK